MKQLAIVAVASAGLAFSADETTFHIGHHEKFVNITFDSEADIETIVGTTNKARGTVKADLDKGAGSVEITVPVASLKTGIDLRDEHLRSENWLDAAKHPEIRFASKKVEPVKDAKNKVKVTGEFTMHGVTKEMTVVVDWKELPAEAVRKAGFPEGRWLKFSAEFPVKLTAYGVKIPDGVGPKVSETWTVKMTVFAGTAPIEEKKK